MSRAKSHKFLVANGVLLEAPIFEQRHQGSNWMAVIDLDPTMPGGLSRRWLKRGRGECLYMLDQLALFDAVEFGADYTFPSGTKQRDRWYGIVTAITDGFIRIEEAKSGAKAIVRAKEARTSRKDRAAALRAQKDALVDQAAKLEAEILELESPEAPEPDMDAHVP